MSKELGFFFGAAPLRRGPLGRYAMDWQAISREELDVLVAK